MFSFETGETFKNTFFYKTPLDFASEMKNYMGNSFKTLIMLSICMIQKVFIEGFFVEYE